MTVQRGIYRPVVKVDLHPLYASEEAPMDRPQLGIVHTTQGHNVPGLADITGVAKFLDDRGLEIHAILDAEANWGMSLDPNRRDLLDIRRYDHVGTPPGSPSNNSRCIGVEQIGMAETDQPTWFDKFADQLRAIARFMAYCRADPAIALPLNVVSGGPDRIVPEGPRGWCGHFDVSGVGGHWDPGPGYPLKFVVETLARSYYANGWTAGGNAVLIEKRP